MMYCTYKFHSGFNLKTLEKEINKFLLIIKKTKQITQLNIMNIMNQVLENLITVKSDPHILKGNFYTATGKYLIPSCPEICFCRIILICQIW